jgi:hypothetical protein
VQQLQSASSLQPGEAVFKELAAAKVEADKAAAGRELAEQKQRDEALKAQRDAASKQVQAEKEKRDRLDADRRKAEEARAQTLHDGFLKQAGVEMAKKEYAKALASAEAARRYRNSPEATKLAADARQQVALAGATRRQEVRRGRRPVRRRLEAVRDRRGQGRPEDRHRPPRPGEEA